MLQWHISNLIINQMEENNIENKEELPKTVVAPIQEDSV